MALLYEGRPEDREVFQVIAQYLRYPAKFRHSDWTLIADLPKQNPNGRDVLVFEGRYPAQFYKVVVKPDGDKPGLIYGTGSGHDCGRMAATLAFQWHEFGEVRGETVERVREMERKDMLVPHPWQENYLD